jgi:hypothetical protein
MNEGDGLGLEASGGEGPRGTILIANYEEWLAEGSYLKDV